MLELYLSISRWYGERGNSGLEVFKIPLCLENRDPNSNDNSYTSLGALQVCDAILNALSRSCYLHPAMQFECIE